MSDEADLYAYQVMSGLPEPQRAEFMVRYHARKRDRSTALLLSVFGGLLGIDRFYLGQTGLAVCKLLFCWATCGIWKIIDIFLIMGATDRHNITIAQELHAFYAAMPGGAPMLASPYGLPTGVGTPPPQGFGH